MRNGRPESLAVQHFRDLCGERPLRQIRKDLKEWLATKGEWLVSEELSPSNLERNIKRFVDGTARHLSPDITPHFTAFCREALLLDVTEDEFDIPDRSRDFLGEFCLQNRVWRSMLDELSDEYILIRPRQESGKIVAGPAKGFSKWKLLIRNEGNSGRHVFKAEITENRWVEGNVVCDGDHIILVGVEADRSSATLMIMASHEGNHNSGILIGSQLTRVVYDDEQHIHHQIVAARAITAVKRGRDQEEREKVARAWLDEQRIHVSSDTQLGAGFVVHLPPLGYTPRNER